MEQEVAKTSAMEVSVEAELAKTPQAAMEVTAVAELETTSTACDAGGWANAARGRGVVPGEPRWIRQRDWQRWWRDMSRAELRLSRICLLHVRIAVDQRW